MPPVTTPVQVASSQAAPAAAGLPVKPLQAKTKTTPPYLKGLGNVAASATVTVRTRGDGELMSLSFGEGELVQKGQLLASLDSRDLEIHLVTAGTRLEQDQAQLVEAKRSRPISPFIPQLEAKVNDDQAEINNIKLRMDYNQIRSPIAGLAGLRMVDAGNMVRAGEPIVVITQLQPAAVLFRLPEDELTRIHASLKDGASPVVEAWNRDNSVRIATGYLTAVDNQIDEETGTIKLKATFDNRDGELVPRAFVNVRLVLNGR